MHFSQTNLLPLTLPSLLVAGPAQALDCIGPYLSPQPTEEPPNAERLRNTSKQAAAYYENGRQQGDVIVVGRFSKVDPAPFWHIEQRDAIYEQFGREAAQVHLPDRVEYTYFGAYAFEGFRLAHWLGPIPMSLDAIDVRVISPSEYGFDDLLPPTDRDVVGLLTSTPGTDIWALTASLCPIFHPIDPVQRDDLLACFGDGACRKAPEN